MREAVICDPVRTAVGRFGGALAAVPAAELGATVIRAILQRTGLPAEAVDDVILGQCNPSGEAPAIGRVAALDAGLPVLTPGAQVDRRCGSGLQAVCLAAMQVQTGVSDVLIAGGAESMSQVEYYTAAPRFGNRGGSVALHDRLERARVTAGGRDYPVPNGMLETAENVRKRYGIGRAEQDELAAESHARAVAATTDGRFKDEIVPVIVPGARGESVEVTVDEHPRADTTAEKLGRLKPVLAATDPESTVTAGNASGQNDGASACLVTSMSKARELGLEPMARIVGWAVAGVEPSHMGIGPVPAVAKLLGRAGLGMGEIDLIELNEAFAVQVLGCTREWEFTEKDFERLNVNGSGISLGHPVGATGGRILATVLHELRRRDGRYALETLCIGGGQGIAALFENVAA